MHLLALIVHRAGDRVMRLPARQAQRLEQRHRLGLQRFVLRPSNALVLDAYRDVFRLAASAPSEYLPLRSISGRITSRPEVLQRFGELLSLKCGTAGNGFPLKKCSCKNEVGHIRSLRQEMIGANHETRWTIRSGKYSRPSGRKRRTRDRAESIVFAQLRSTRRSSSGTWQGAIATDTIPQWNSSR